MGRMTRGSCGRSVIERWTTYLATTVSSARMPCGIRPIVSRSRFQVCRQGGFTTALAFRIDRVGDCTVANAGHVQLFLNRSEMTLDPSLPLGIDPEAEYKDQDSTLDCGDRLILHTDGVLEARSEEGE